MGLPFTRTCTVIGWLNLLSPRSCLMGIESISESDEGCGHQLSRTSCDAVGAGHVVCALVAVPSFCTPLRGVLSSYSSDTLSP